MSRSESAPGTNAITSKGQSAQILVDRIACSGHGICAQLLAGHLDLDEWGYPIVRDGQAPRADGDTAIRMCPARALSWSPPR